MSRDSERLQAVLDRVELEEFAVAAKSRRKYGLDRSTWRVMCIMSAGLGAVYALQGASAHGGHGAQGSNVMWAVVNGIVGCFVWLVIFYIVFGLGAFLKRIFGRRKPAI